MELLLTKYNYWIYILVMMVGLYAMLAKNNLIKKIIGMGIFQTAIIVFYVSIGAKKGGTIPIIEHGHGQAGCAGFGKLVSSVSGINHQLQIDDGNGIPLRQDNLKAVG